MTIVEILMVVVLTAMLGTWIWFLSINDKRRYQKANRILWNVLGYGFALFMILVLITVVWLE